MDYRYFGRTGVDVSPLCLGCMNFGGRATKQESTAIIEHALDKDLASTHFGVLPKICTYKQKRRLAFWM